MTEGTFHEYWRSYLHETDPSKDEAILRDALSVSSSFVQARQIYYAAASRPGALRVESLEKTIALASTPAEAETALLLVTKLNNDKPKFAELLQQADARLLSLKARAGAPADF